MDELFEQMAVDAMEELGLPEDEIEQQLYDFME